MWITNIFNRNTAYPHVDRLCVSLKKLFTLLTAHSIPSFAFAALNLSAGA